MRRRQQKQMQLTVEVDPDAAPVDVEAFLRRYVEVILDESAKDEQRVLVEEVIDDGPAHSQTRPRTGLLALLD